MPEHPRTQARVVATAAVRWFLALWCSALSYPACSSDDPHPAPVPPGSYCDPPHCDPEIPIAAVAIERTSASDGGSCGDAPFRMSLPEGDDALSAILSCGGNKIRCGTEDYRVSARDLALVCTVLAGSSVHLAAHVSRSDGALFGVDGDLTPRGGTVTVSAKLAGDGGVVDPMTCQVTSIPFLAPGSIWANFDCNPDADGATCHLRGTFVFENCATEMEGGSSIAP